ncbi:adenosine receptor A1-like [Megalops cyprinoides]|uniref:adenosine receptor A1-like n=1 Tax=Megalops cyprinoides TaxID=118141 RepID=UPI0018643351|nr:adenosine receptor A1-like [Megalops cyprinoides]
MQHMWLHLVCECLLCLFVIGVSVRMCMGRAQEVRTGVGGSVSVCLRLCLGWVGAVGAAVGIPVSVLLNLRTPQCLYTCLTLVCCPLLVRQFTMCLLLLLALNSHLHYRLGERYVSVVTRRRVLCLVLLSWVCSVLTAYAQFIGWNALDTWGDVPGEGTAGLGLGGVVGANWTTPFPPPKYPGPQDRSIIGKYLPYGGFLSKFYVEDMHNFTYAEIHGSHWGVCAPDTVLSPQFLVYVYAVTVFLLPLLVLLGIYLDLMCVVPKLVSDLTQSPKGETARAHSLALSLSLLVLLCLPLHTCHAVLLFSPSTLQPSWAPHLAALLFQLYGVVPPLLYTPVADTSCGPLPRALSPSTSFASPRKDINATLLSAVQRWAICCPTSQAHKVKVCPQV